MYGGLDLEDYKRGEERRREQSPTSNKYQLSKMTAGRWFIINK